MVEKLGCYARIGHDCRGCGGRYIDTDAEAVKDMAGRYEVNEDHRLVKKKNGAEFPLCGPLEDQIMLLLREAE